jgi:hypothetical protein
VRATTALVEELSMTVQDATRTVDVPRQAGPVDPPLTAVAPTPATPAAPALLGRDRPLTPEERGFALGLVAMLLVLGTIIVAGLLLGQYAWS